MPRDNWCMSCDGMFHDDQMGKGMKCIYCEGGVDSDAGAPNAPDPQGADDGE